MGERTVTAEFFQECVQIYTKRGKGTLFRRGRTEVNTFTFTLPKLALSSVETLPWILNATCAVLQANTNKQVKTEQIKSTTGQVAAQVDLFIYLFL